MSQNAIIYAHAAISNARSAKAALPVSDPVS